MPERFTSASEWARSQLDVGDIDCAMSSSQGGGGTRGGRIARMSRAATIRSSRMTMRHRPTGVEVAGEVPPGRYTRKEQQRLKAELETRLFEELAAEVVRARRARR